jgi:hypothetical protein
MEDSEDDNEFYFESTHLALRSNSDYLKVMKHLALLCSIRIKIHNDIEILSAAQIRALEDPQGFVRDIFQGQSNLPGQIEIPEVTNMTFFKLHCNFRCHFLDSNS